MVTGRPSPSAASTAARPERPLRGDVDDLRMPAAQPRLHRTHRRQAEAQLGVHRDRPAASAPFGIVLQRGLAVLSGADEVDRMAALAQVPDDPFDRQRHAVDFRWPGFGDKRDTHCKALGPERRFLHCSKRAFPLARNVACLPRDMDNSLVLVPGGAGFLGSHLCETLLAEGYDVLALDDLSTGHPRHVEHLAAPPALSTAAPRPDATAAAVGHASATHLQPRLSGQPGVLPAPAGADAADQRHRRVAAARADLEHRRAAAAGLDQRGLRRPAGPSADRELPRPRQPDRPALVLRRRQALRRSDVSSRITASATCRCASPASSTATARGCGPATAAWSATSSCRRCAAIRSPSTATACRRAASATWTTPSKDCCG